MVVNIDDEELEQLLHTDENIRLSSEEIQNLLNDLEHENDLLDTVNSNVKDGPPKSIPIQDEAINNKQQQIYVKTVHINPQPVKITIKDGKTIYHIQIPKKENSQLIQDFMKGYLHPNRKYYIMFDLEETNKQFCREYCNIFGQNGSEIIRSTKQLEVIEEEEERNRLIKNHHEGKTNHRGITETLSYLQTRYHWNKMDTQVTNYINKCEICKKMKYDRNPPKLPLNLTDTYEKPFEKIHIDTLSIQNSNFLTIVDAFTKIGQAYHIAEKWYISEMHNYRYIIDHLQEEIESLIKQILPSHRQKRGIMNGLGSVIKIITGNMNQEDVERINQQIQDLQQGQKNNAKLTNSFCMIVRTLSEIRTALVLRDLTSITDFQSKLPVNPTTANIMVLESLIDIKAYQQDSTIIFLLEAPLVDKTTYDLYHLYSLPIPINNAMKLIIPSTHYSLKTTETTLSPILPYKRDADVTIKIENKYPAYKYRASKRKVYQSEYAKLQSATSGSGLCETFKKLCLNGEHSTKFCWSLNVKEEDLKLSKIPANASLDSQKKPMAKSKIPIRIVGATTSRSIKKNASLCNPKSCLKSRYINEILDAFPKAKRRVSFNEFVEEMDTKVSSVDRVYKKANRHLKQASATERPSLPAWRF
ncbi:hypothetical protein Trydic_g22759 [Trypoxylus dichotomus]